MYINTYIYVYQDAYLPRNTKAQQVLTTQCLRAAKGNFYFSYLPRRDQERFLYVLVAAFDVCVYVWESVIVSLVVCVGERVRVCDREFECVL